MLEFIIVSRRLS